MKLIILLMIAFSCSDIQKMGTLLNVIKKDIDTKDKQKRKSEPVERKDDKPAAHESAKVESKVETVTEVAPIQVQSKTEPVVRQEPVTVAPVYNKQGHDQRTVYHQQIENKHTTAPQQTSEYDVYASRHYYNTEHSGYGHHADDMNYRHDNTRRKYNDHQYDYNPNKRDQYNNIHNDDRYNYYDDRRPGRNYRQIDDRYDDYSERRTGKYHDRHDDYTKHERDRYESDKKDKYTDSQDTKTYKTPEITLNLTLNSEDKSKVSANTETVKPKEEKAQDASVKSGTIEHHIHNHYSPQGYNAPQQPVVVVSEDTSKGSMKTNTSDTSTVKEEEDFDTKVLNALGRINSSSSAKEKKHSDDKKIEDMVMPGEVAKAESKKSDVVSSRLDQLRGNMSARKHNGKMYKEESDTDEEEDAEEDLEESDDELDEEEYDIDELDEEEYDIDEEDEESDIDEEDTEEDENDTYSDSMDELDDSEEQERLPTKVSIEEWEQYVDSEDVDLDRELTVKIGDFEELSSERDDILADMLSSEDLTSQDESMLEYAEALNDVLKVAQLPVTDTGDYIDTVSKYIEMKNNIHGNRWIKYSYNCYVNTENYTLHVDIVKQKTGTAKGVIYTGAAVVLTAIVGGIWYLIKRNS